MTHTYLWNFGDGNTSNLPNPTHTYAEPGTYTVTLLIDGTHTQTKINYVQATESPLSASIVYVDLQQNTTGFLGAFPEEPMGYTEFIASLGNSDSSNTTFKLKGTITTGSAINFQYFHKIDQWLPGEPWRISTGAISISANKLIKGGVIKVSSGDIICGDNVNFNSCYIICVNFRFSDPSDTVRVSYFNGCSVKISSNIVFTNSKIVAVNSVLIVAGVSVAVSDLEEIIFRHSVVNLNTTSFSTAFRENSDNNTNQFGWTAPTLLPAWDTCEELDFNFPNILINSGGDPYTGYELGLFGTERADTESEDSEFVGIGATGALKTLPYADFFADVQSGPNLLSVKFMPIVKAVIPVSKYTWYFGDGLKSKNLSPTHTYQHGGDFSIILEVLFSNGTRYKKFKKDFIKVFKVKIIPVDASGAAPLNVQFSTAPSLPYGVSVKDYDWDFGDESAHSTESNPAHLFNNAGTYDVSLTDTFTSIL